MSPHYRSLEGGTVRCEGGSRAYEVKKAGGSKRGVSEHIEEFFPKVEADQEFVPTVAPSWGMSMSCMTAPDGVNST